VALALVLLFGGLLSGLATPVRAAGDMPAVQPDRLLPSLSQAMGHADVAYHARVAGDGVVAGNPEQALDAAFDAAGLTVTAGGQAWGMRLTAYGYGDQVTTVPTGQPRAAANRIEIDHGPLSEWYLNGPWGLEQGFTLSTQPAGAGAQGELTLHLAHTGGVATVDANGAGMTVALAGGGRLRYTGLTAVDATGRSLPARLHAGRHGELEIRVDDAGAIYPLVVDPFIQYAKLTPSTPDALGALGSAVVVTDEIVAVGGPGDDGVGTVYLFERTPGSWEVNATPLDELMASDGEPGDYFGAAVAIDGDRMVIGAPYAAADPNAASPIYTGAVYVFERSDDGSWADPDEVAKLQPDTPQDLMHFGEAVALHGDDVVVGAQEYDNPSPAVNDAGAAFVFEPGDDGWDQVAVLTAPSPQTGAYFGNSVAIDDDAIDGEVIVVGAPASGLAASGEAYVYVEDDDEWTHAATLLPAAPTAGSQFGEAVAIAETTVLVGAPKAGAETTGAAYLFAKPGGGWLPADVVNETAILTGSDQRPYGDFGAAVALDASQALVGSTNGGAEDSYAGAAYLFRKPVGDWVSATETTQFVASDGADADWLGAAVALDGDLYVAGAPQATVDGETWAGAAYVFSPADLAITKAVTPSFVFPGDAITYTLTFTNSGPLDALDVVITDTIPVTLVTNLSVDSTVSINARDETTYVWDVADLAAGASGVITVTGQVVSPLDPTSFDNTASISTSTLNGDPDNDSSTVSVAVLGRNDAAIEGLTAGNNSPKPIGQSVQFTAAVVAGDNVYYTWTFGDGQIGSGASPLHAYAAKGSYTAEVTATNGAGSVKQTTTVTITDIPITGLTAGNNGPKQIGQTVQLNANVVAGNNVTYAWKFGDGQSGTGANPTHAYAAKGTYTAEVTASNGAGSVKQTTSVTITDNPIAGLTASNDGPMLVGEPTHFSATITGGSNVTYAWTFGDGQSGTGATPTHTYAAAGSYTARVTASNGAGNAVAETQVTIAPYAVLTILTAGSGEGTVTRDPALAEYTPGTVVELTAIPAAGSLFAGWSGAVNGTTNPVDVTMNGNKTVTATFVDAQAPQAVADAAATLQGASIGGNVLANDVDPENTALTVSASTAPAHGTATVAANGVFSYTPAADFVGLDSFGYTVTNAHSKTDTGTVYVHVTGQQESADAPHVVIGASATTQTQSFLVNGRPYTLTIPAGAYDGPAAPGDIFRVLFTPLTDMDATATPPRTLKFGGVLFRLEAFLNGTPLGATTFAPPLEMTFTYDPALLGGADPATLEIRFWDGAAWSTAGLTVVRHDPVTHQITFTLDHLSAFALFVKGQGYRTYIAQVLGNAE
jgi:uncharacterized repeat protein (TIGR01451 family)